MSRLVTDNAIPDNSMKIALRISWLSPARALFIAVTGLMILSISACLPERSAPENEPSKAQAESAPAITPIPRKHLVASIGGRSIFPPAIVKEWIESEPAFTDKIGEPRLLWIRDAFPDAKYTKGWFDTTAGMVTFCPDPYKKLVFSSAYRESMGGLEGGRWIGLGENNHSTIKLPPNSSIVVFATRSVFDAVIDLPGEVVYLVHVERESSTVSIVEITGGM